MCKVHCGLGKEKLTLRKLAPEDYDTMTVRLPVGKVWPSASIRCAFKTHNVLQAFGHLFSATLGLISPVSAAAKIFLYVKISDTIQSNDMNLSDSAVYRNHFIFNWF